MEIVLGATCSGSSMGDVVLICELEILHAAKFGKD